MLRKENITCKGIWFKMEKGFFYLKVLKYRFEIQMFKNIKADKISSEIQRELKIT